MSKPFDDKAFKVILAAQEAEAKNSNLTGQIKVLASNYTNVLIAVKDLRQAQEDYAAQGRTEELGRVIDERLESLYDLVDLLESEV